MQAGVHACRQANSMTDRKKKRKKNALTVSISSLCIAGFCENFARFPVKTISSQRDAHTYAPQL